MNTRFEKSNKTTNEWYTPPEIIRSMGEFDLDPCSSTIAYELNHSAKKSYTKEDDGLSKEWFGRIWLNPPYDQPLISHFVKKWLNTITGLRYCITGATTSYSRMSCFPLWTVFF